MAQDLQPSTNVTEMLQLLPSTNLTEAADVVGQLCVVCHGPLAVGDATCDLPCGHRHWHAQCVLTWLELRRTCPICRAPALPFSDAEDSDSVEDDSEWQGTDDQRQRRRHLLLRLALNSMRTLMVSWEMALHSARDGLVRRVRQLEEERRLLGEQVRAVQSDLAMFNEQVARLNGQRDTLCLPAAPSRLDRRDGHAAAVCSDSATSSAARVASRSRQRKQSDADIHTDENYRELAGALVDRLRDAVLHVSLPGVEVFRVLTAPTGLRLGPQELSHVLEQLTGHISSRVSAHAFAILDVNASGFVEEADWMVALRLPRVCVDKRV
eukprot:gnl/TRDRNA2_/TRDRNA2_195873_c0_seq1.p1 gnl/TRDRNA2_/TRDRNA2_195873_c0~~gnl/TRDRNA2_/TRDRNA2_195873_c0_seq1.p1  ORF type:complete len:324 (+),score=51.97 gnl/TRDRNA2_/TRDRNA2_195873_c0_seq1:50-1021(+)